MWGKEEKGGSHLARAVIDHGQRVVTGAHRQEGELLRGIRARAVDLPFLAGLLVLDNNGVRAVRRGTRGIRAKLIRHSDVRQAPLSDVVV